LRVRDAAQLGFRRCVVPEANAAMTDLPGGLQIVGVRTAADALETLL
jgi:DNA repair protein RadA/Sms